MKKLFITIAFVAAAMFASAQLYVGGSLGFDTQKNSTKDSEGTQINYKTFAWDLTPSVGFMFADNMGVGLDFGFGMTTATYPKTPLRGEIKVKGTDWAIAPYFRYVFAEVDNFKFYADAKLGFGGTSYKVDPTDASAPIDPSNQLADNVVDGDKVSNFGFAVVPGMAYMITDNISMNCTLNILSLGFNQEKYTTKIADENVDYKTTDFGFGVNRATPITIGFFYTF